MSKKRGLPFRQRLRAKLLLLSFLLFPITIFYFSPALVFDGAAKGIINGSFIVFGLLFLSALVLGRSWCAWACPGGGLGEACMMSTKRKAPGGRWDWIKYLIWAPWLGSFLYLAVRSGGYHTVDPFFKTWHGISLHAPESYIAYFIIVALIVTLAWWPGRRGFCHYACWMAPFMVIGVKLQHLGGWPALRLKADPEACKQCGICAEICPMSLDVPDLVTAGDMRHSECILCGSCVDNCKAGAISYTWRRDRGGQAG